MLRWNWIWTWCSRPTRPCGSPQFILSNSAPPWSLYSSTPSTWCAAPSSTASGCARRLALTFGSSNSSNNGRCAYSSSSIDSPPGRRKPSSWSRPEPPSPAGWRLIRSRRRPPGELVAPLVGRAAAFTQLVGSFQQARQGRPQAALVEGEAGIGKTRLAHDFGIWARAQGADVLSGQAFEMGGRLPYQPLVEAVRQRLEEENAPEDLLDDLWLAELSRLVPE